MATSELFKRTRLEPISLRAIPAPPTGLRVVGALPPASGAAPGYQLPFTMQRQAEDQWCWSAVTVSVSVFYLPSSSWTQCSLVCAELGNSTCCTDGSIPACNQPWTLDAALLRTNNLLQWAAGTAPAATIQTELGASRPICCRIGWNGGGGHFVAISGYQNDGTDEEVTVEDPFFGQSQVNLATFTTAYQNDGVWTHTYYTKA
jgi:hypothetical protein